MRVDHVKYVSRSKIELFNSYVTSDYFPLVRRAAWRSFVVQLLQIIWCWNLEKDLRAHESGRRTTDCMCGQCLCAVCARMCSRSDTWWQRQDLPGCHQMRFALATTPVWRDGKSTCAGPAAPCIEIIHRKRLNATRMLVLSHAREV